MGWKAPGEPHFPLSQLWTQLAGLQSHHGSPLRGRESLPSFPGHSPSLTSGGGKLKIHQCGLFPAFHQLTTLRRHSRFSVTPPLSCSSYIYPFMYSLREWHVSSVGPCAACRGHQLWPRAPGVHPRREAPFCDRGDCRRSCVLVWADRVPANDMKEEVPTSHSMEEGWRRRCPGLCRRAHLECMGRLGLAEA